MFNVGYTYISTRLRIVYKLSNKSLDKRHTYTGVTVINSVTAELNKRESGMDNNVYSKSIQP